MKWIGVIFVLIGFAAGSPPLAKTRHEIESFREALEKSRTDDGFRLDSRMLANPDANVWENSGKFQGDILLDDELIEELVADYANNNSRAAYVIADRRWPGAIVPFEFGVNHFTAAQQQSILTAMQWVEHFSCVRFRRRRPQERDFVWITGRNTGCYARVGFVRNVGYHTLNLARPGCLNNIIIIHELLHNLGFFHMQSAYERYHYVRINWNNIANGMAFNFYRLRRNQVNLLGLPYEYQSCMHYGTHAFSINGRPTIDATRSFQGVMGHMRYVTTLDWMRLRRHYNCPGAQFDSEIDGLNEEVESTKSLIEKGMSPPLKPYDDIYQEIKDYVVEETEINDDDINMVEENDINNNDINIVEDVESNGNDVNVVDGK